MSDTIIQFPKQAARCPLHLGAFDGENLSRSVDYRPAGTTLQDFVGMAGMLVFCAAIAVILIVAFGPELPA